MKTLASIWLLISATSALAQTIVCSADAPANVKLAAKEIRRYAYLRTGKLLPIAQSGTGIALEVDPTLEPQAFRIRSNRISGGSEAGVLYGAYRYVELLGVRFYLHGDVLPDERLRELPVVNDTGKPLFALRGVNPWGSHPFGFDAWSADDYKAIITQLAKMRMNFIGMHCYPQGKPFTEYCYPTWAEPTVWHGLPGDADARGKVTFSYTSRYYNTAVPDNFWGGYFVRKTGDYGFGAARLFEDDLWAPEVMRGNCPQPATPEACNEVFNRTAGQFNDAFTFARQLGVKTCLGTEAPLILPVTLRERLQALGKDVTSPAVKREIYEGTFKRIKVAHPLDYYWIWTPESWTAAGNKPTEYQATVADIKLASEALKQVNAPFDLATCGWVLGPQHDRAAFDNDMPKDIPMSAISREMGYAPVDPAFARIAAREKWAIPWLEGDAGNGLAGIQLWAGRMRRDAADARQYACTGLMGLHWRTEILSPNASALAQAAWDQGWSPAPTWTIAGQIANYPDAAIAGTTNAPLYRSCRYDLGSIRLPVPNGEYIVTLKFCEPHFGSAGERVFDVQAQGKNVVTNLDIFAQAGKFAALDYTCPVVVTSKVLAIDLVPRKSLPCISAIAVQAPGFSRKINCGGGAYDDWLADVGESRSLPVDDFYADWALANFGLAEAGQVFAAIDGKVPQVGLNSCPVFRLTPDGTPWASVAPRYAFVNEFDALRPRVRGPGNLARFDYWLNTFKYYRALARTCCAMGAKRPDEVRQAWAEAYTCLLATVNSPGALAMVVNMENNSYWGPAVAKAASQPMPKEYSGPPRLVVPCVRSIVTRGESLRLRILALEAAQPTVQVRPLGKGSWQPLLASHLARGVYEATLPNVQHDLEYYIAARAPDGQQVVWPAAAPQIPQTVVLMDE